MDVFLKFIVEGNNLIIAKCTYHKQLATDIDQVKGGGWWQADWDKKEITLSGDSHDFGRASEEDIKACIEAGNVFLSYVGGRNVSDHIFYLNTGYETIKLNTPPINMEKKKITALEDIPEFHESLENMSEETKQRADSKLKAITETCTLTDFELIDACEKWIDRLCKSGGDAWTLEVPVNMNRDPDMLFAELVQRFYKAKNESPAEQPVREVELQAFLKWLTYDSFLELIGHTWAAKSDVHSDDPYSHERIIELYKEKGTASSIKKEVKP